MSLPKLNPVEPPWYGPVCPVVGEGWHREVSPYPDLRRYPAVGSSALKGRNPPQADLDAKIGPFSVTGYRQLNRHQPEEPRR
jgi:hypothetical protein